MKRWLVLSLLVACAGTAGGYLLLRHPKARPLESADSQTFQTASLGRGLEIQYHPGDVPIRTLAWMRPLSGGAVLAQLLSQSGRQQVFLYHEGASSTLTLTCPGDTPLPAFQFAELEDAALVRGHLLLLLYRTHETDHPALLIAWDLPAAKQAWDYRGDGSRLATSPDGTRAFLFGDTAPVQILTLDKRELPPVVLPLPPGASAISDLLPLDDGTLLAACGENLACFSSAAWTMHPGPAPSPLGFKPNQGRLARTPGHVWWQPEPGRLREVAPDGSLIRECPLDAMIQGTDAQDGPLLQLLGSDSQGRLWFAPEAPTFQTLAPDVPGVPVIPAPQPDAPDAAGEPPQQPSVPQIPPPTPAAWAGHLNAGLGRLYCWTPGTSAPQAIAWGRVWQSLGAPADLPVPQDAGGLVPSAGGCLLGDQMRRWWLPLSALAAAQPR